MISSSDLKGESNGRCRVLRHWMKSDRMGSIMRLFSKDKIMFSQYAQKLLFWKKGPVENRRVIILIGPPSAGKTTTAAALVDVMNAESSVPTKRIDQDHFQPMRTLLYRVFGAINANPVAKEALGNQIKEDFFPEAQSIMMENLCREIVEFQLNQGNNCVLAYNFKKRDFALQNNILKLLERYIPHNFNQKVDLHIVTLIPNDALSMARFKRENSDSGLIKEYKQWVEEGVPLAKTIEFNPWKKDVEGNLVALPPKEIARALYDLVKITTPFASYQPTAAGRQPYTAYSADRSTVRPLDNEGRAPTRENDGAWPYFPPTPPIT